MADKNEEIILKGRLKGWQRMRLTKLLDMMYKPSEIAEIIEFERRQFYRVYIPAGCPHQKDGKGYLWINGKGFREWYEATYPRVTLGKDEKSRHALCMRTRTVQFTVADAHCSCENREK